MAKDGSPQRTSELWIFTVNEERRGDHRHFRGRPMRDALVVIDARSAVATMQLVVDALTRGQGEEALRYLREVHEITERIEQHLNEAKNAEPRNPDHGKAAHE